MLIATLVASALIAAGLAGCGTDKSVKYYNMGLDAANADNLDEAVRLWTESLKYQPDNPGTRFNLGVALLTQKKYALAEEQLREATRLNPQDYQAFEQLGKSLEAQDSLVEAKRAYEFATNINPNFEPALAGRASIALKENQNETAEDYATRATQIEPEDVEANLMLSEAYDRLGSYEEAYAQLASIRRLAPNNPKLFYLLGKVAYARRQYSDALDALGTARNLGMTTGDLFLYLGLSSRAVDDQPGAEKYFKLAVFKNDTSAAAWKGLAQTYVREKKWSDANEAISKALVLDPDDGEMILDRGFVKLNAGDPAAAVRDLEEVANRSDAPPITFYYLGHAYLRSGDREKARIAFRRFVDRGQGDKALLEEAKILLPTLSP
jgi:tetratricopeptide (TPR) repeat protein